MYHKEGIVLMR